MKGLLYLCLGLLAAFPASAADLVLRARLRDRSPHELVVRGLSEGKVRLQPVGEVTGELLVPLAEARRLQFTLPASYREAQQSMQVGRPEEALRQITPLASALLPYVRVPETNAVAVVDFYVGLLIATKSWPAAIAVVNGLPLDVRDNGLAVRALSLVNALVAADRLSEALLVIDRMPVGPDQPEIRAGLAALADALRRSRHFREARLLYEKLQPGDPAELQASRSLLLAYLDYQDENLASAAQRLEALPEPSPDQAEFALHLLLQAHLAARVGDATAALDAAGRALVWAPGDSEWRAELLAIAASAYAAVGRPEVAAAIRSDLRQIYPSSSAHSL